MNILLSECLDNLGILLESLQRMILKSAFWARAGGNTNLSFA